jgi:hypothetical protein
MQATMRKIFTGQGWMQQWSAQSKIALSASNTKSQQ